VEEVLARLQGHLPSPPPGTTQINYTTVAQEATFPLHQTLYFDFSHDTNIMSIITAMGLRQFAQPLPATGPPANQQLIVSHMTPFGARLVGYPDCSGRGGLCANSLQVIEVITTPQPLKATRPTNSSASMSDYYTNGTQTTYVHFTLSQRTIPLWKSYPECEQRDDGWCELSTVLQVWEGLLDQARYDYACNGHYSPVAPTNITDGAPITKRDLGRRFGSGLEMYESSDRWVM
jgi:hypothetical protein